MDRVHVEDQPEPPTQSSSLAIHLACSAYQNHIEAELAPTASAYRLETVAPRATHPGRGLTLMPLHGLNVWSLVHHDTVVLSRGCLDRLEERLLAAQKSTTTRTTGNVMESSLRPEPADWHSAALDDEGVAEGDGDGEASVPRGRRIFSDPVGSEFWQRVKLRDT